jgi:hypothetical protein
LLSSIPIGIRREIHSPDDLRQLALDDPRTWLIASARYFQGLGFYMQYLDLPDDALLYAIRQAVRWHWDEPLPPEEVSHDLQLADMVLLLGDQSRVWWRDLEGVFVGEDFYVTSLTEWSAISRGAFSPLSRSSSTGTATMGRPMSNSYWVANAVWSLTPISATTLLTSPSSRRSTAS